MFEGTLAPDDRPITELLVAASDGNIVARDRLWSLVYDELHRVAERQLGEESCRDGRRLQPTTLIGETYLRLFGNGPLVCANRRHFFAAAANAMRRIRVDGARKKGRLKRGGRSTGDDERFRSLDQLEASGRAPFRPVAIEPDTLPADADFDPAELIDVDEALKRLEHIDREKAEVVTLRYFAGLSVDETAAVLGVSARTVDSQWQFARAWLHRELSGT